jgi:hypothetical protein
MARTTRHAAAHAALALRANACTAWDVFSYRLQNTIQWKRLGKLLMARART